MRYSKRKIFNLFNLISKFNGGTDSANFLVPKMENIDTVEGIVLGDIFRYDIDIVEGALIGKLAKTSVRKHSNTLRLLHYISHFCKVSNINAFFERHHCHWSDHFIGRVRHLERHLIIWKERVKHIFRKNVYQLRETVLDKFDSFAIHYRNDQRLFEFLNIFDFGTLVCRKQILRYWYYNWNWQASSNCCIKIMHFDWRTNPFTQIQCQRFGWVIHEWFSRVTNTEQSTAEIEVLGPWSQS